MYDNYREISRRMLIPLPEASTLQVLLGLNLKAKCILWCTHTTCTKLNRPSELEHLSPLKLPHRKTVKLHDSSYCKFPRFWLELITLRPQAKPLCLMLAFINNGGAWSLQNDWHRACEGFPGRAIFMSKKPAHVGKWRRNTAKAQ